MRGCRKGNGKKSERIRGRNWRERGKDERVYNEEIREMIKEEEEEEEETREFS